MLVKKTVLFIAGGLLLLMVMVWVQLNITWAAKMNMNTISAELNIRPVDQNDSISLAGVIDFHCHTGPDVTPRSINDLQLARLAKQAGMRGIVLKNHYTMTADRAALAMQEVTGIEVFGGIVLNRSVGGINVEAVNRMVQFEGHRGKVVWLPTTDAENNFGKIAGPRLFVPVVKKGKLVPELTALLQVIAKNDLVLETGHSSPVESLLIIAAAKQTGVKRIIVTHAMMLGATIDQMKQMTAMGAVIEYCWQPAGLAGDANKEPASINDFVSATRAIGAEHFIIDSDLGQKANPLHTAGMRAFIATLRSEGLSAHDINIMACQNPATLLGLEPAR